mgnify:CR=1 FL=1
MSEEDFFPNTTELMQRIQHIATLPQEVLEREGLEIGGALIKVTSQCQIMSRQLSELFATLLNQVPRDVRMALLEGWNAEQARLAELVKSISSETDYCMPCDCADTRPHDSECGGRDCWCHEPPVQDWEDPQWDIEIGT